MKKRTPISNIMTSEVSSVNVTQSIREVADLIKEKNFRHVPVVSGTKVVGMISKTDLERISFVNTSDDENLKTQIYDSFTIEQVMTKDVKGVQQDETIHDVAVMLTENEFHAFPVLDGENIVGIVTSTDLIKFLIEQF